MSQKSIKLFDIAKKLGATQEILVAKKGFDDKSLDELYEISKELKNISGISKVEITKSISKEMKQYLIKNYYLLSKFDDSQISKQTIKNRLQNIYDKIYSSAIYEPINTYDPLELFSFDSPSNQKYTKLKNYGYVLKAQTSIDTSSAFEARKLYVKINNVLEKHTDTIAIAPFFYLVENSAYIKSDAQKIMLISTLFLLVLYFFVLRNLSFFKYGNHYWKLNFECYFSYLFYVWKH